MASFRWTPKMSGKNVREIFGISGKDWRGLGVGARCVGCVIDTKQWCTHRCTAF